MIIPMITTCVFSVLGIAVLLYVDHNNPVLMPSLAAMVCAGICISIFSVFEAYSRNVYSMEHIMPVVGFGVIICIALALATFMGREVQ